MKCITRGQFILSSIIVPLSGEERERERKREYMLYNNQLSASTYRTWFSPNGSNEKVQYRNHFASQTLSY
jgi:hypothetical protein